MSEKKIMIVDDDKIFLAELKDLLLSCGYDIVDFSDSRRAFSASTAIKPDIILLDLKMDGINGLQFADKSFDNFSNRIHCVSPLCSCSKPDPDIASLPGA
jgi:CheY-like chemotaxis protein